MSQPIVDRNIAAAALDQLLREHLPQLGMSGLSALILLEALAKTERRLRRLPLPQNQSTIDYVYLAHICHVEAERQYCIFHLTDNRRITVSRHIGVYEKLLNGYPFVRVHRSHIINLEHVCRFHRLEDTLEITSGKHVPVARNMRETVLQHLASF